MQYHLVLFDLDGTISDPLVGIHRSINHALAEHGFEAIDEARAAELVGPPLDGSFRVITGTTSDELVRDLVATYRERYADVGFAENTVYPGVPEVLAQLDAAGLAMGVCTSKRRDFAVRILDLFGLAGYFGVVDGGDVGIEKWQQIGRLHSDGYAPGLLIGDRAVDLEAAHRNGIDGGAVTWGYGSRAELESGSPEHWFESPADWLRLV